MAKINKILKFSAILWVSLMVLVITIGATLYWLTRLVTVNQTAAYTNKIEIVTMGHLLSKTSDFLTSEIRSFSVNQDEQHLRQYWYEVDVAKQRDYAVAQLKLLGALDEEIALLAQSKRQSDALIDTETRAMKLILSAYGIEDNLMHPSIQAYRLSAADQSLTPTKKIAQAQTILFDQQYQLDKTKIMAPIAKFLKKTKQRSERELQAVQQKINIALWLLWIQLGLLFIVILITFWVRSLYLRPENIAMGSDY